MLDRARVVLLLAGVALAGCPSVVSGSDAAADADVVTADVTGLIDTPVAQDRVVPSDGSCAGPMPSGACVSGTPGGACGDAALQMACIGGSWGCPAGTIPISQCACVGPPPPGCMCTASGLRCSDGGDVVVPADAGCPECVSSAVTWGFEGGFVAYTDRSSVTTCRTFTFERDSGGGPPSRLCSNDLPACGTDNYNLGDLAAALADPDVVRALASAPVLYGRDSRPVDGQVFLIDVGGRAITIGDDCRSGDPSCVPAPPGVVRLRGFLELLTRERLRFGTCATAFPDAG